MSEVWRDIKGYEGLYQVSNIGRVRSVDREVRKERRSYMVKGQLMKLRIGNNGYYRCSVRKNGKIGTIEVHRAVAEAFIPNPCNFPCVNHKNEIKTDNRVENLEWCSYSYNNMYGNGNEQRTESKKNAWKVKNRLAA